MSSRAIMIALFSLTLTGCGVKSDLQRPSESMLQKQPKDPSKPPVPLGEPTRVTPPYTTGP
jgi:predicted small lipoprotein YifL